MEDKLRACWMEFEVLRECQEYVSKGQWICQAGPQFPHLSNEEHRLGCLQGSFAIFPSTCP